MSRTTADLFSRRSASPQRCTGQRTRDSGNPSPRAAFPTYRPGVQISIEPLRPEDAPALVAAEDEQTVRWLSEEKSTVAGTSEYIAQLARGAEQGRRKRAFGIWLGGHCVGTVDYDPDVTAGIEPGDVNISYGVAPWVRGRGIAVRAVELICTTIRERGAGHRAVIRTDARNAASVRVAEKAGFERLGDLLDPSGDRAHGTAVVMHVFGRDLHP